VQARPRTSRWCQAIHSHSDGHFVFVLSISCCHSWLVLCDTYHELSPEVQHTGCCCLCSCNPPPTDSPAHLALSRPQAAAAAAGAVGGGAVSQGHRTRNSNCADVLRLHVSLATSVLSTSRMMLASETLPEPGKSMRWCCCVGPSHALSRLWTPCSSRQPRHRALSPIVQLCCPEVAASLVTVSRPHLTGS
jgi:hypothetical protein